MDKESFITTLIAQYTEEIEEILLECEHVYKSTIDYELLEQKVEEIFSSAKIDGLDEKIVWDLIQARIPSYVNYLNYKAPSKKAA
jgi:uncharacterized protein (UPF0335 family)